MDSVNESRTVVVAVPVDAVADLKSQGLAFPLPAVRGAVIEAVMTVGTDAAMLVSLLQAPDAIRSFAAWVRGRYTQSGNSIELSAQSGDRRVHLRVDGNVDIGVVADFLKAAMDESGFKDLGSACKAVGAWWPRRSTRLLGELLE
jgi:hypothetical protein